MSGVVTWLSVTPFSGFPGIYTAIFTLLERDKHVHPRPKESLQSSHTQRVCSRLPLDYQRTIPKLDSDIDVAVGCTCTVIFTLSRR